MKIEFWANVKGFEGVLMVSSLGRLKVLEKTFKAGKYGNYKQTLKAYYKRPIENKGVLYYKYKPCKQCKEIAFNIRRLVASHFVFNPQPENFRLIGYLNGNKQDFNAFNLVWTNRKDRGAPIDYQICKMNI